MYRVPSDGTRHFESRDDCHLSRNGLWRCGCLVDLVVAAVVVTLDLTGIGLTAVTAVIVCDSDGGTHTTNVGMGLCDRGDT